MRLTHLASASVIVETDGTKILTDPWLVDGEYYGSWFHLPPLQIDLSALEYDYIYVSHIHPDHMSKKTLACLDQTKPVLIHNFEEKFLKRNIENAGFSVLEIAHGEKFHLTDKAHIAIYAADNCNPELCGKFMGCSTVENKYKSTQIDTLSVISDGRQTVLNTNDCPFALSQPVIDRILSAYSWIDMLLVGYAGAGPFPQCFVFPADSAKKAAAQRKQAQFLEVAADYINKIKPRYFMPFAGTYVLGGRLAGLNSNRGVPQIGWALEQIRQKIEVGSEGILLNSGEFFDVSTGVASAPYRVPDTANYDAFLERISGLPYDYDDEPEVGNEKLMELSLAAYDRFKRKADEIGFNSETEIQIVSNGGFEVCFGTAMSLQFANQDDKAHADRFVRVTVDRKLLGLLLKGPRFAHWNNAEIGSHLQFERKPEQFERGLYHSLCFFHA